MSNAHMSRPRTGGKARLLVPRYFPPFDGIGGHLDGENWLNNIEELLETTSCMEEQKEHKVTCLAYKLFGEVKRWW
jgi:hypothetical protein